MIVGAFVFPLTIVGMMEASTTRWHYLGNLPTLEKKLRVAVDWFVDLFFKRDVTRLKTLTVERSIEDRPKQTEVIS